VADHNVLIVEVALDLKQPLETLAGNLQRSPASIVNQALEEYIDRRLRGDRGAAAVSTSSYVELTAREDEFDFR
jgi:predicted transcriptional regulator